MNLNDEYLSISDFVYNPQNQPYYTILPTILAKASVSRTTAMPCPGAESISYIINVLILLM